MTKSTKNETAKIPVFIGVTGHRNIRKNDESDTILKETIQSVVREIRGNCKHTEFILLTALASGADQLAAQAIIDLSKTVSGVKYAVILPMEKDLYLEHTDADGTPDFDDTSKEIVNRLINDREHCAFVYTMPVQKKTPLDSDIDQADLQFRETARFISDNSHVGIALWNGILNANNIAGTGTSVRDSLHGKTYHYSRISGITIPETRPIYHIYTPLESDPPHKYDYSVRRLFPEPLLETGEKWFTLNDIIESGDDAVCAKFKEGWHGAEKERKRAFIANIQAIDRYNKDVETYDNDISCNGYGLNITKREWDSYTAKSEEHITASDDEMFLTPGKSAEICESYFKASDRLASIYQNKRKHGIWTIVWLAGFAYIMLNIFSDLMQSPLLLSAYFELLITAVIINYAVKKHRLHSRFVDYRALAEGLRVQYYWYAANISDADNDSSGVNSVVQAQNYYLRRQKGHIEWIRYALRNINLLALVGADNDNETSLKNIKDVSDFWLGRMDIRSKTQKKYTWVNPTNRLNSNGQVGYFLSTSLKSKRDVGLPDGVNRSTLKRSKKYTIHLMLNFIVKSLITASLAIAFLLAICLLIIPENPIVQDNTGLAMFISGLLPVVAMVLREISTQMGYEDDVNRYTWSYNMFKRAIIEIDETYEDKYQTLSDSEKCASIKKKLFEIGKEALVENADWVMLNEKRAPEVPSN